MGASAANFLRLLPRMPRGPFLDLIKEHKHIDSVAASASILTVIVDLLEPFTGVPLWAFLILSAIGVLVALCAATINRFRRERVNSVIVFWALTGACCAGVLAWHGVFGRDPIHQLVDRIGQLDKDARDADKQAQAARILIADTNTKIEETNRKLATLVASLNPQQRTNAIQFSLTTGLSVSIIVMLQTHIAQSPLAADPAKANALLIQNAALYSSLEQALAGLKVTDFRTETLLQQARLALAQGDLEDAGLFIREVADINRSSAMALANMARGRALDASGALQQSADVAEIALRYKTAAKDLRDASRLVAPYDPHLAWKLTTESGDALVRQVDQLGDQNALGEAADAYRDALSMVSQNPADQEFIRTRDSLSNAVARLNQIPALAERHRAAIEALDRAGNPADAIGRNETANGLGRGIRGAGNDLNASAEGRNTQEGMPRNRADQLTRKYTLTGTAGRHRLGSTPTPTLTQATPAVASAPTQSSDEGGLFGRIKNWVKEHSAQSQATGETATPPSSTSSEIQNAVTNASGGKLGGHKPAVASSPRQNSTSTTTTHKTKKGTGSSN